MATDTPLTRIEAERMMDEKLRKFGEALRKTDRHDANSGRSWRSVEEIRGNDVDRALATLPAPEAEPEQTPALPGLVTVATLIRGYDGYNRAKPVDFAERFMSGPGDYECVLRRAAESAIAHWKAEAERLAEAARTAADRMRREAATLRTELSASRERERAARDADRWARVAELASEALSK